MLYFNFKQYLFLCKLTLILTKIQWLVNLESTLIKFYYLDSLFSTYVKFHHNTTVVTVTISTEWKVILPASPQSGKASAT